MTKIAVQLYTARDFTKTPRDIVISLKKITQFGYEADVKWYIVEEDICQGDSFESLDISLRNLKDMGLK